jgi:hypothetical protein
VIRDHRPLDLVRPHLRQETGRQISAVSQANGKHIMFNQASVTVRALGIGSFNGAMGTFDRTDGIDFSRVVETGVEWFGTVIDHFGGAQVCTDPDQVLRAMPSR